jgi:hypothetical protein
MTETDAMEMAAYSVAKHFSISLADAYAMPLDLFFQSLEWAITVQKLQAEEMQKQAGAAKHSGEAISLDYFFPEE